MCHFCQPVCSNTDQSQASHFHLRSLICNTVWRNWQLIPIAGLILDSLDCQLSPLFCYEGFGECRSTLSWLEGLELGKPEVFFIADMDTKAPIGNVLSVDDIDKTKLTKPEVKFNMFHQYVSTVHLALLKN